MVLLRFSHQILLVIGFTGDASIQRTLLVLQLGQLVQKCLVICLKGIKLQPCLGLLLPYQVIGVLVVFYFCDLLV